MRWLKILLYIIGILIIVYLFGPRPETPKYTTSLPLMPAINELDKFVAANEAKHKLKPDNEARIVWANDSLKQKTEYAIVYLHGFSASQEEGDPVHRNIAKTFGCNLYLSRLAEHGIDTSEQLVNLTADNYWESVKEAFAIGKKLGNKVIVMGTSTGATQAIQLAATYPNEIAGLILYSPNIAINDKNAWLLNDHWGLQIARLVKGCNYNDPDDKRSIYKQYWNKPYRLEALVTLEEMLETTMNKDNYSKVKQPVLMLYYYKDEQNQDKVVKVSAMKEMFEALATDSLHKKAVAIPDAGNHVIASPIKSGDVISVENETKKFLEEVMQMKAVK
ncbi:alpha/beta hydrolase [Ferruginibacter sp. SUN106]|uniref:alpha/beta hydrolase n=1 Tax=Ferruginibacter sp. SUN106 TaxID=2978348 RepID=UPI003D35B7B6